MSLAIRSEFQQSQCSWTFIERFPAGKLGKCDQSAESQAGEDDDS
jgi:hypothetical protein